MGIATDIKRLGEDIVTSYDTRVKAIGTLVKDTHNMLGGFQREHKEMADNLKADLAKGEEERLKAFKPMMAEIQKEIKGIEAYVAKKLKEFSDAHTDMSEELRKELAKYVVDMVKTTKKLMGDIQKRQEERNTEVSDLLEAFKTEREKMAANWQALTETMAKRRGAKPVVSAGAEIKTVEEAVAKRGKKRGRKKGKGKKKG